MRRISLCLALALMAFAFAAGAARANTMMQLSASHISFYNDQFEVEADGNVRVTTSDGFTVTGDAFSMDLKLNRFLVAGHVTLQYGNERFQRRGHFGLSRFQPASISCRSPPNRIAGPSSTAISRTP